MAQVETAVPETLVTPRRVVHAPAHANNFSAADAPVHAGYRPRERAKALVFHTPEEAVDNTEVTPSWFANPAAGVSTDAYADSDGDLYVMVGDRDAPFGNGAPEAQRHWKGDAGARPPWHEGGVSYNVETRSIEIEGFAQTMHRTFLRGGPQWRCVVAWAALWVERDEIPPDRDHLIGHEEIDSNKGDPGLAFDFPMDELVEDIGRAVRKPQAGQPFEYEYLFSGGWEGSDLQMLWQAATEGRVRGHEYVDWRGRTVPSVVIVPRR